MGKYDTLCQFCGKMYGMLDATGYRSCCQRCWESGAYNKPRVAQPQPVAPGVYDACPPPDSQAGAVYDKCQALIRERDAARAQVATIKTETLEHCAKLCDAQAELHRRQARANTAYIINPNVIVRHTARAGGAMGCATHIRKLIPSTSSSESESDD